MIALLLAMARETSPFNRHHGLAVRGFNGFTAASDYGQMLTIRERLTLGIKLKIFFGTFPENVTSLLV